MSRTDSRKIMLHYFFVQTLKKAKVLSHICLRLATILFYSCVSLPELLHGLLVTPPRLDHRLRSISLIHEQKCFSFFFCHKLSDINICVYDGKNSIKWKIWGSCKFESEIALVYELWFWDYNFYFIFGREIVEGGARAPDGPRGRCQEQLTGTPHYKRIKRRGSLT